jgi:hypothetical protein
MYVLQSGELKKKLSTQWERRKDFYLRTISLAMRNTVLRGNPFDP